MKRILFILLLFFGCLGPLAFADIQVIQLKRNIPLSDDEPIYKDYYLSGGAQAGLRVHLVVPVMRWVNLRENNQAQDQSMKLLEPVGWLKIIYVQEKLAVARLYEMTDYEMGPIMEQPGIMIGDVVTLEKSFIPKPAKKVAQAPAPVIKKSEPPREPMAVEMPITAPPVILSVPLEGEDTKAVPPEKPPQEPVTI